MASGGSDESGGESSPPKKASKSEGGSGALQRIEEAQEMKRLKQEADDSLSKAKAAKKEAAAKLKEAQKRAAAEAKELRKKQEAEAKAVEKEAAAKLKEAQKRAAAEAKELKKQQDAEAKAAAAAAKATEKEKENAEKAVEKEKENAEKAAAAAAKAADKVKEEEEERRIREKFGFEPDYNLAGLKSAASKRGVPLEQHIEEKQREKLERAVDDERLKKEFGVSDEDLGKARSQAGRNKITVEEYLRQKAEKAANEPEETELDRLTEKYSLSKKELAKYMKEAERSGEDVEELISTALAEKERLDKEMREFKDRQSKLIEPELQLLERIEKILKVVTKMDNRSQPEQRGDMLEEGQAILANKLKPAFAPVLEIEKFANQLIKSVEKAKTMSDLESLSAQNDSIKDKIGTVNNAVEKINQIVERDLKTNVFQPLNHEQINSSLSKMLERARKVVIQLGKVPRLVDEALAKRERADQAGYTDDCTRFKSELWRHWWEMENGLFTVWNSLRSILGGDKSNEFIKENNLLAPLKLAMRRAKAAKAYFASDSWGGDVKFLRSEASSNRYYPLFMLWGGEEGQAYLELSRDKSNWGKCELSEFEKDLLVREMTRAMVMFQDMQTRLESLKNDNPIEYARYYQYVLSQRWSDDKDAIKLVKEAKYNIDNPGYEEYGVEPIPTPMDVGDGQEEEGEEDDSDVSDYEEEDDDDDEDDVLEYDEDEYDEDEYDEDEGSEDNADDMITETALNMGLTKAMRTELTSALLGDELSDEEEEQETPEQAAEKAAKLDLIQKFKDEMKAINKSKKKKKKKLQEEEAENPNELADMESAGSDELTAEDLAKVDKDKLAKAREEKVENIKRLLEFTEEDEARDRVDDVDNEKAFRMLREMLAPARQGAQMANKDAFDRESAVLEEEERAKRQRTEALAKLALSMVDEYVQTKVGVELRTLMRMTVSGETAKHSSSMVDRIINARLAQGA